MLEVLQSCQGGHSQGVPVRVLAAGGTARVGRNGPPDRRWLGASAGSLAPVLTIGRFSTPKGAQGALCMEIAILFALILLNGLFAMSEIALVTARKARLQKLIDEGDSGAAAAVKLGEDPTRFLSTIQIGITSIGVLNGIVGEAALAGPLALWLEALGVPMPFGSYAATGLVVVLITYFSIVVGELVPKRIGQSYPETFARLVARPTNFLPLPPAPAAAPDGCEGTQRQPGDRRRDPRHAGGGHHCGRDRIARAHHGAQCVPAGRPSDRLPGGGAGGGGGDVVCLDMDASFEDNLKCIKESAHARFPVVRGGMDNILGVINARQ